MNAAPATLPRPARIDGAQWLARLTEHLPAAFIRSHAFALLALRGDGADPAEAATYARAFMGAPSL